MSRLVWGATLYFGMQFVMKQFMPAPQQSKTVTDANGQAVQVPTNTGDVPAYALRPNKLDEGATWNPVPQKIAPMWPDDSVVDIIITLSPSMKPKPLRDTPEDMIVFRETEYSLGNWSEKRTIDTTITVPASVQNNGTLWGHFYVGLHEQGVNLDPTQKPYDPSKAYYFLYPFTQYIPKKKVAKTRSLLENKNLTEAEEAEAAEAGSIVIGNYYHPNTTISFVPGAGTMMYPTTNGAARQFITLEPTGARDGSGQNSWYYPILFVNGFWQLKSHFNPVNETVKTLPLHIELNNLANWKFQLMASVEFGGRESARQAAFGNPVAGGGDGSEIEMVKEIFLDTNPILLGITIVVSIAHMLLETLAFGSDIAHYRKKKDNVGISVRTILANVFMQTIIFLYLVDNSQNTSWMILGTQGVGIVIELWKVTTVVNIRVRDAPPGSWLPKHIVFEDKHKLSETEQKTQEYDAIAFKYMYWVGVPLLIAYAIYSLVYEEHKSWYSFIITTLVGSVYAYGFLMMVPALYINYRLKSVAHMPGKAMMYKFLNTFIDDLFAFTIKMPILHRLATFRDDIIFFVYIYQRWAYKIDYTRVNEFGQGGDDEEEEKKEEKKEDDAKKELPPALSEEASSAKTTGASSKGKATKRK
ncbi:cleft lip and palate transmembrane 1 [Cryphonectria parasitica EP155]|uniref:Cleft lip and palate transmembrane 1 n=1 Tax=Cryphonectria parasitica (strain ATCC 38755 / EP155) TaxID=660469 RepID=A0A9P4YDI5_CRYP1|nr:cleft lip and palate transmembrane 1 [Cryphonectria parasitica EP155]KAF3771041.1 cleft lip and palate transmembrane 1 [Cryphonectria parasitica EP155]